MPYLPLYDTFFITTDSRWTIASGAACSSADYSSRWNNFNGTSSANPHSLQCLVTPQTTPAASQSIYIYGLAVDGVDTLSITDNQYVDLRVTGVTSPNSVYSGSTYAWTIATIRFGTTTYLEAGSFTSGPLVTNDVISTVSWGPTWGSTATNLLTGQSAFFDLAFTLTNAIPLGTSNGYITITFTETIATIDTNWMGAGSVNCYIVTYLGNGVDCSATTNTLTISGLPAVAAGTAIKVRNILTIVTASGSTTQITSINTFQGISGSPSTAGYPVDIGTNLGAFAIATSSTFTAITGLLVGYHASGTGGTLVSTAGGSYTGGVLNNYHLQFAISGTTGATLSATSQFTINCPLSSTIDDFSVAIPSPGSWKFTTTGVSGLLADVGSNAAITPTVAYGTSGTTLGSIVFAGTIVSPSTFSNHQHLLVQTGTGTSYIALPRVANNYATAYECRVAISTTSQPTQTAFVRLAITSQPWQTAAITISCKDRSEGLPLLMTIQPNVALATTTTSQSYYVEVSFDSGNAAVGLGSGLAYNLVTTGGTSRNHDPMSQAVDYPYAKPGTVPTSAKMYAVTGASTLAFGGFGAVTPSSSVSFYAPIGGLGTNVSLQGTIRSLYFLASDPRYKFTTHSGLSASLTLADAASWSSFTAISGSNTGVNGSPQGGLTFSAHKTGAVTGIAWSYLVLPVGFKFPTNGSIKNLVYNAGAGVTFSQAYWFSSPTSVFAFPGVLFSNFVSAGTPNVYADIPSAAAVGGTFTLTGFNLALGSNASLSVRFASGTAEGSACEGNGTLAFSSTPGTITAVSISPSSIKQRGPDGVSISHTVSFTLQHEIPTGGTIVMTFDNSNWNNPATLCTGCSVTGLTAATTGGLVTCSLSSGTVTISTFAPITTSSSTVTITVFGLLAPISVTSTALNFVTALTTYTGSAIIDQASSVTGSAVSVTAGSPTGLTTWTTKKTYPSTAGATLVDMYLKFSMPHALPACGSIAISSPLTLKQSGDVKNACFFSPLQYSSCNTSGSVITLILAQAYTANSVLELYLDAMVDNPTTTASTSTGFLLTASWASVNVDIDNGSLQSSQTYSATSVLSTTITPSTSSALSFSPKTSCEVATYIFDFKDSANFAVTDQYWIVFPSQYDYFLGDIWTWFTNEPNVYYIDCSSTQLGVTWCQVDHNIVIVSGSNAITASTQIILTINNIVNPIVGQTSAFQVYHVDGNGNYLTVNQNYGTVTPTVTAAFNIGVRSLVMGENRLFKSSDYTWRLYFADTINTDSQIQVLFPREYNLRLVDKKDSYTCSTTWLDISNSATIKTQQNWNSVSSCPASGNLITLSAPTNSMTFSSTNIVTLSVQSVGNPQFGQTRTALSTTQDFDVTDSVLWPLWTYWVSKFTFFVYRTSASSLVYTSRSYPNMNAAYANLYDGYRSLLVNGYNPQSRANRIVVYAGTQSSDVLITTVSTALPLAAKTIVLTPVTNSRTPDGGKLKYTSVQDEWTLFQSYYSIQFRVCAAIDTTKGLYYIDWSNNETKQTGLNDVQYNIPASTLVEVVGKTAGKYTFGVSTIPNVSTGFTSVPIKVTISNAPCLDVTVNIAVSGAPANISVTPATLTFNPDVNILYFQIQVASNYDLTLGTVQTLLLTLTGTDAYAYSIAASTKFTITQSSVSQTPGNIVTWGLGQPAKTSISVSPSSDQVGVLYYQLAASGTAVPSFSTLKSSVTALINSNGTSTGGGKDNGANSQSDPRQDETWEDFQRRLYRLHLQTKWTGSISMYATTAVTSLSFTWLWAASTYQISGYLDNLSTSSTTPPVRTETFTTLAIADSQPVSLKFTGLVAESFSSTLAANYASVIGVNPTRLAYPGYITSASRVLQTGATVASTTFSYTLLVNRFSESPSPTDQAKVAGTSLTSLNSLLAAGGLTNALNSVTATAVPTRVTPAWTLVPSIGSSTVSSVVVNLRSSTVGRTCCVALTGSSLAPTAEQIMLALDASNGAASGTCMNTDLTLASNSLQIVNLQSSTSYYVYCTATDNYPLWPTYMVYSTTSPQVPVTITTQNSSPVIASGASHLGELLALLTLLYV